MSDGSRHALQRDPTNQDKSRFTVRATPVDGKATLRVAYFFSGISRKASIGNSLNLV